VLDVPVGPAEAGKATALRTLHRAWEATRGDGSVIGLSLTARHVALGRPKQC
jgi:ABC-type phosphate/phosphonate transport system ATPase subunit